MHKERVKKLIEALESGEYTQSTKSLRNCKGFCVLGVAADLYIKENSRFCWSENPLIDGTYDLIDTTSDSCEKYWDITLPEDISSWYDFNNDDDELPNSCFTLIEFIVELNDSTCSFKPVINFLKNCLNE